jgi:hypothetical protein
MNDMNAILNDQICLKKEISDSDIIQATSLIIDEWEARLPYSPIGTFSQDTTFVKLIDHACFRIEIESQVVYRTLQENHIPDDGENCPEVPDDLKAFDVWSQNYPLELDFQDHGRSIQIAETRARISCERCEGNGKTACAVCDGSALVRCGKGFFSSGCGGSGQVDITRERKVLRDLDYSGRPMVGMDGSHYRTVREVIGTKNCSECHGSGQVKCQKCIHGLVQCDKCEGKRTLIKYSSVEQKESPIKGQTTYISSHLPLFRSTKKNPTTNLSGDLCFSQDQGEVVSSFDISEVEANEVLVKALNGYFESDHKLQEALSSGKVFRQLVKIYNCPVSEYFYTFNDNEYSIFVNRSTKVVEDLTGPIAQESENLLDQSKTLAKEKKYLKSFAANQKAKTLLSSNPLEIKTRKALVDATELGSLGIEKSKQLFSKFFKKSSPPENKDENHQT